MDTWELLSRIFSRNIRMIFRQVAEAPEQIQEIRLRIQSPLLMICNHQEVFLTPEGRFTENPQMAYQVTRQDMKETLEYIGNHSLYAFEEEIRQGFITIPGGHRIGLAGKVVADRGEIRSMKFITFLNVRLAHEVKGCADTVMPFLFDRSTVHHTLVISPPRCGKTTLLRDMIRQVSVGSGQRPGMTVGVVDERSELAACYQGVPQNDLGIRTDVLDCCPKALGMMMLIRTMAPQVVAVDEIGSRADLDAMEQAMSCGCRLIATVHGSGVEDIRRKPVFGTMMAERWFERFVVLKAGKTGEIEGIYDGQGIRLL